MNHILNTLCSLGLFIAAMTIVFGWWMPRAETVAAIAFFAASQAVMPEPKGKP